MLSSLYSHIKSLRSSHTQEPLVNNACLCLICGSRVHQTRVKRSYFIFCCNYLNILNLLELSCLSKNLNSLGNHKKTSYTPTHPRAFITALFPL